MSGVFMRSASSAHGDSQLDAMMRATAGIASRARPAAGARHANGSGNGGGTPTLLCASGRGGSGTSLVAALIAVAAAGDGRRVLLVDADDLVGPQALLLGVPATTGWQDLRGGHMSAHDVATSVSASLTLVAGGVPRRGEGMSATPNATERRACMRRVSTLGDHHDLVVIDCGARLEPLFASVAPQLHERVVAVMTGRDPITLAATFALCKATNSRFPDLMIDVVANRQDSTEGSHCFDALDAGVRQFLPNCPLRFAGAVPLDSTLDTVLRAGMPFLDAAAGSPAATAAYELARRSLHATSSSRLGV